MRVPRSYAIAFAFSACATAPERPQLTLAPHVFVGKDGRTVESELGRFSVPEDRADPNSRRIELAFVRFRSTAEHPGNPIVYLAGGPGAGGTQTAAGWRFNEFMALRARADVIAFDQRGTGLSHRPPDCATPRRVDLSAPLTRDRMIADERAELTRCRSWWRERGVELAAYNTRENAADVDDLRRAIGAERIDLWAISYGTHLGAAYLRAYERHVGRAVFAGYEGPNDTVKFPSHTDAMLARFAAAVAADPVAGRSYPDLLALMRRVLARLEAEPATVTIDRNGTPVTLTIGAFPVQNLTGAMIADPRRAVALPALYLAMDRGEFGAVAKLVDSVVLEDLADMRAMTYGMDLASGISSPRRARVEREEQRAILGDALNFPERQLLETAPELDLGEAFRAPLEVDTPILFISGTLDGRTYPEAAREALVTLPNSRQLIVINGGHNIYEADPRMREIVRGWFQDGVAPDSLTFRLPQIPPP